MTALLPPSNVPSSSPAIGTIGKSNNKFMRVFLAALMVLLSIDAGRAADAVFPPGSAVGLSPPPGMSPAKSFAGFQDEARGASILMFTFPPVAYPDMASGFSDDGKLAQQGVTAEQRETLTLVGNP